MHESMKNERKKTVCNEVEESKSNQIEIESDRNRNRI
jgi:hypothetical protein